MSAADKHSFAHQQSREKRSRPMEKTMTKNAGDKFLWGVAITLGVIAIAMLILASMLMELMG